MIVIGHRGAAGLAPENTISSLQAAIEAGANMVEVDLRITKDGFAVLSHDPTLARTHDDRRQISELTLPEIQAIGQREAREIPELSEFLQQASLPVNLELKDSGLEPVVLKAIEHFPHKVLISSSLPQTLKKIRALDRKIPLGFIIGPKAGYVFPLMLAMAKRLDLYSIHPVHTLITPGHMRAMRRLGVKVFAWTVNNIHDYLVVRGMGADGVFTDYPNIIKD
jgi:glycerophosphoryl diester phosphodiesterase